MASCKWCRKTFRKNKNHRKYCSAFCRKNGTNFYRKGKKKYHQTIYWSKHQNKEVRLKSSYELTYCEYLNSKNVKWWYEPKKFYMDDGKTYYLPDFYLPDTNEWKEVKGKWYKKSKDKFERFQILYPNEKIEIVGTEEIMRIRKEMKSYSHNK